MRGCRGGNDDGYKLASNHFEGSFFLSQFVLVVDVFVY